MKSEGATEKDSEDPIRSEKSLVSNMEVNSSLDTSEPSQEMLNREIADKTFFPQVLSASEVTSQESSQFHFIKWIMWKGILTPTVTQDANGPCSLLAIVNVLLLKRQIHIVPGTERVTSDELIQLIGHFIFDNKPKNIGDAAENYEQNLSDMLAILPKLQSGIDVNVKFTSVSDFEFTPELALFDLVQIKLFHGWVIDREQLEEVKAVGKRSYNQLVEMIISSECGDKQDCLNAEIAKAFLEQTATQLTYQGLADLTFTVQDDELAVFFRNNHFSTIYKTNNQMFTLLTDQGFLKDDSNIWETLQDIDGSGIFVNSSFMIGGKPLLIIPGKEQEGKDEQLAHQLQQEEERRAASDLPIPSTSTDSQRRPSTATRRQSANRDKSSPFDLRGSDNCELISDLHQNRRAIVTKTCEEFKKKANNGHQRGILNPETRWVLGTNIRINESWYDCPGRFFNEETEPLPLIDLCRRVIRQNVGKQRLDRIQELDLPQALISYLLYQDRL